MREQIKQIENQRKIDRMGNLLEMDGKCRILGRKSALIDIAGASEDDASPEKKMRTIFNEDEQVNDTYSDTPNEVPENTELPSTKLLKPTNVNSKIIRIEGVIGFENETTENNTIKRPGLTNLDKLFEEPTDDSSDDEFISDNETADANKGEKYINEQPGSVEGLKKILYAKLHDKIVSGKISSDPVEKITISDEEEDQFMSSSEEEESEETKPIKIVTQVECEPKKNLKDKPITLSSSDEEDPVEDNTNVKPNNLKEAEPIKEPASKDIIPPSSSKPSKSISKVANDSKLENLVKQKEAALLARILKSRRGNPDENSVIDKNDDNNDLRTDKKYTSDVKPEGQVALETDVKEQTSSKHDAKPEADPEPQPENKPTATTKDKSESNTEGQLIDKSGTKAEDESDKSDNKTESTLPESEPEVEPVFDFKLEALRRENELSRIRLENASKITQAPSSDLYLDAAQLLNLFGAGIMFAPGEAEAQCARLEYDSITEGTITDDSDTFLFGGRRVYRNMTPGKMTPILHSMDDLEYNRNQLIGIAHLTGSDYCTGVNGIGPKVKVKLRY